MWACICKWGMACLQAAQPQAAEPISAGDGGQAPPATFQYTGPDDHILHELDLVRAKACLTRVCAANLSALAMSDSGVSFA